MSDTDLVECAQTGDTAAFDQLVSIHQERVFALAYRIMGSREDAADIQQETFLRAWQSLRKFRGEAEFSTWLYRITVNLCISRRTRKGPDSLPFDENLIEHSAYGESVTCADRVAMAVAVRTAMSELPANHRALIVLREIEGRQFEEIAAILGCSVESARVRSCKARKLLRDRLRPYLEEEDQ